MLLTLGFYILSRNEAHRAQDERYYLMYCGRLADCLPALESK